MEEYFKTQIFPSSLKIGNTSWYTARQSSIKNYFNKLICFL